MRTDLTDQNEDHLPYEVSDEALETAVGNVIAGNYTLGACYTAWSICSA